MKERQTHTIPEAGRLLRISRGSAYKAQEDVFRAEFAKQKEEHYGACVQLAHTTLAGVMDDKAESGLTGVRAAQAELLYDGQRRRARVEAATAATVLDKLGEVMRAMDSGALEAHYRELTNGDPADDPI